MSKSYLITGGAGFIGSNFVELIAQADVKVVVLDALTYAGHRANLPPKGKYDFIQGNICDPKLLAQLFADYKFDVVVNFAAESHVDRSIEAPTEFVNTNVLGVCHLLNTALQYWSGFSQNVRESFRFIQVSTDEVYGELGDDGYFTEKTPYGPNSPYSASKAGGDFLARAWYQTYKLPVIVTNCSNNYGPRQYPEKLIPLMIRNALSGKHLPVYGDGRNVRDWIHVDDHCAGIKLAIEKGQPGETYCFGGRSERRNIDVVKTICAELDRTRPKKDGTYSDQIKFVEDRKGHDWRYAIDDTKAESVLGFQRRYSSFEDGLRHTVRWYLENDAWMNEVLTVPVNNK